MYFSVKMCCTVSHNSKALVPVKDVHCKLKVVLVVVAVLLFFVVENSEIYYSGGVSSGIDA